ncbi:cyclin-O [Polypterus senegalus]
MVAFTLYDCEVMKQFSPIKRKREGGILGHEDVTPEDRPEAPVSSANVRAPVKRARNARDRKQGMESMMNDSGIGVFETPSPTPERSPRCPRVLESPLETPTDWGNFRDYGEACYHYKKSNELRFHPVNCLALQPQITAESRCKLVSWLIPVHRHFKLSFESFCLAINIMDRFLITTPVASDCFQLLGVTSLLIACKQVEVHSPRVKQLLSLCCDAFTKDQLCNLECIILMKLNFNLTAPTIAFFLEHLSNQRLHLGNHSQQVSIEVQKSKNFARKISELSMADYAFNRYPPSLMAICSMGLADQMLGLPCPLDKFVDGYPQKTIEDCLANLRLLVSLNQEVLQTFSEL